MTGRVTRLGFDAICSDVQVALKCPTTPHFQQGTSRAALEKIVNFSASSLGKSEHL